MPHRLFEALKAKNTAESTAEFNRILGLLKKSYQNNLNWLLESVQEDETLFTCAVENNRIKELKELLIICAQNAIPGTLPHYEKPNTKGVTPMVMAINKYNIGAMRLLIQFGVKPNDIKMNNQWLIQYAAKKAENPVALIFLISVGTKLTVNVEENETPLAIVSNYSYTAAQIYIEAGLQLQKACENIMSYQSLQIRQDYNSTHDIDPSLSLISQKSNLITIIEMALSACLKSAQKLMVDFLENLENNLVQYQFNEQGKQLIYQWLIKLSDLPVMLQKFIKIKNNISNLLPLLSDDTKSDSQAVNELGYTQLHIAIIRKNRELLIKEIESRADVNLPDKAGNSPVILAALNDNREAMIFLIAAGADFNFQLLNGTSAATIAKQNKNTAMEKILDAASLLVKWVDEVQRFELFVAPNMTASGTLITPEEKEGRCITIEKLFNQMTTSSAQLFAQYLSNLLSKKYNNPFQEKGMCLLFRCLMKLNKLPDYFDNVYLLAASYLYNQKSPIAWLILDKAIEFNVSQAKNLMHQYFDDLKELNAIEMELHKFYLLESVVKPDWYYCIDITKKINQVLNTQNQFKNADVNSKHYILGRILFNFAVSRTDKDIADQDLELAQKCFLKVGSYRQAPELLKKVNESLHPHHGKTNDQWKIVKQNANYDIKDFTFLTILHQLSASEVGQEPLRIQNDEDKSGVKQLRST